MNLRPIMCARLDAARGLRRLAIIVAALAVAVAPVAAQPRDTSGVRVLAIAPFSDENPLNRRIAAFGAARVSELLQGGRLQIVDAARVAAELQRQGLAPTELISPSKTIAVGIAVGADAVLTGRMLEVLQEPASGMGGDDFTAIEGRVTVDILILDVRTHLKFFEGEVNCSVPALVAAAMECVARRTAARVNALWPRN
jgi:hypothetical protein